MDRPTTAPPSNASHSSGSIVVGVRVRPLTVAEQYGSQRSLIRVVDDKVLCFDPACGDDMHVGKQLRGPARIGHRAAKDQKYAFDCVFDIDATQEQVYQKTARPQIESVLSGYNATVFAYGATGARARTLRWPGHQTALCSRTHSARPPARRAQARARRTR
jgi:hypothetical protein